MLKIWAKKRERNACLIAFQLGSRWRNEIRVNIFPSTLGPHGSKFGEVIEYLHQLREFDKGLQIQLEQLTKVCAFPHRDHHPDMRAEKTQRPKFLSCLRASRT